MEQLDLTAPITAPSVTTYRVITLTMNWPTGDIGITLADQLGGTQTFAYTGGGRSVDARVEYRESQREVAP